MLACNIDFATAYRPCAGACVRETFSHALPRASLQAKPNQFRDLSRAVGKRPRSLTLHASKSSCKHSNDWQVSLSHSPKTPQSTLLLPTGNDAEVELAVFRFTLGIPGFDDTYIPRIIGSLGILVLLANHILGSSVVPDAQVLHAA